MGTVMVDVDEAELTRAAEAAVADLPAAAPAADPAAPAGALGAPVAAPIAGELVELSPDQIMAIAERNAPGTTLLLDQLAQIYAPNWALSDEEIGRISKATSVAMAAWFPQGALPFKWVVLLNLGGELMQVVKQRRDPKTGELKPLRLEQPASSSPARGARDGAAAAA